MVKKRVSKGKSKVKNYRQKTDSKKLKYKKKVLSFKNLVKDAPHAKIHRHKKVHEYIKNKKLIEIPKPKEIPKIKSDIIKKPEQEKPEDIKNIKEEKPLILSTGVTETAFDKLVDYVNEKETVKISQIAKIFKISAKEAEDWGKILQNHNLLHVHYPTFGEPELKKWKKQ